MLGEIIGSIMIVEIALGLEFKSDAAHADFVPLGYWFDGYYMETHIWIVFLQKAEERIFFPRLNIYSLHS